MKIGRIYAIAYIASIMLCRSMYAQESHLVVDTRSVVSSVSPTLYGLMTEEINYSYDGGLYAEMVRNRSFQHRGPNFNGWLPAFTGNGSAKFTAEETGPSTALSSCIKITVNLPSPGNEAGVANGGYWGMGVRPSTTYKGSFYAKPEGVGVAHVRLINDDSGKALAETSVQVPNGDWKQYSFALTTGSGFTASSKNHLEILFDHSGTVSLQLVSLMGPTYHDRPNGNRPDLMELMAAMKPHFLRFPGGNYLEGDYIPERFIWKSTIGPLVDRPTHRSPWNYQSSDGMGLLEFLEWAEDLNIEPLLAVYAGYSLKGDHIVGPDLEWHIQDALDEIEFITGETNTTWGALRAKYGHPKPFSLRYVEIGNEDWFDRSGSYEERFARFAKAIKAKYPQLQLISTMPITKTKPDVQDDHYYRTPEEFFEMVHKYDTMDRNGPKIFVGEWATRTGSPTPDFGAALGDSAWMTSMERNSDLIVMAAYAPLLTNVNPGGMQWPTDLIGYDALRSYGSPAYYAQVLFGSHIGDHTVKTSFDGKNPRFFWSATVSTQDKVLHLKLVNASDAPEPLTLEIADAKTGSATLYTLHADSRWATNTIDQPDNIKPVTSTVQINGRLQHAVPGNTIEVLDIPLR